MICSDINARYDIRQATLLRLSSFSALQVIWGSLVSAIAYFLLQVSRRTVSWFHLINSQDNQDDMTEKTTNPVENKIDNPVIMKYPVDNPLFNVY